MGNEDSTKELSLEEKAKMRGDVLGKIKDKYISRNTKNDGEIDIDGLIKDVVNLDEKLHYTRQEAKDRRLREEAYEKDLQEREQKIKSFEEEELKKQKKFEELLGKKQEELVSLTQKLSEMDQLVKFRDNVLETQKSEVETKINQLGKEQLDLYNTAIAAMPENAYIQKLALLNKILVTKSTPAQLPTGGVSSENKGLTQESLSELKDKDPVMYRKRIREIVRADLDKK